MRTKRERCKDEGYLEDCMTYKGEKPLNVFKLNDSYIIAVYKGKLSPYDIVIRYRQKDASGNWSNIRTPKHIHWTVDMLMKMQVNKQMVENFLDFLLNMWEKVEPIRGEVERKCRTTYEYIYCKYKEELDKYAELSKYGEYSVKFLIFLADLLMVQEKTNRMDAYMFGKLLKALRGGEQIYKIVSIATHKGDGE